MSTPSACGSELDPGFDLDGAVAENAAHLRVLRTAAQAQCVAVLLRPGQRWHGMGPRRAGVHFLHVHQGRAAAEWRAAPRGRGDSTRAAGQRAAQDVSSRALECGEALLLPARCLYSICNESADADLRLHLLCAPPEYPPGLVLPHANK